MTKDSARYFEFDDGTNWQVMKTCLLRVGADAKLLTAEWVEHHYGMIVWKLASMERSMPDKCAGRCLTAERVFLQLKYRYEREINKAHRSAIAKIVEKDDVPHRFLVLCVASIRSYGTEGGMWQRASLRSCVAGFALTHVCRLQLQRALLPAPRACARIAPTSSRHKSPVPSSSSLTAGIASTRSSTRC